VIYIISILVHIR